MILNFYKAPLPERMHQDSSVKITQSDNGTSYQTEKSQNLLLPLTFAKLFYISFTYRMTHSASLSNLKRTCRLPIQRSETVFHTQSRELEDL